MTRLPIALLLLIVCSDVTFAQSVRRVQPLLGVGQDPSTAPPSAPADPTLAAALFDDQGTVQEISLEINDKDWQALKDNYLANTYYPADFRWNGQVVRNVGIRSRGTASRSPTKPSLRIDFDRYDTSKSFLGLKSIVVKNNVSDPSNMHERLSMHLFERMGFKVPREASVRILVNGVYDGLYTLVESPDKAFLARTIGENDGYLYKFDRNTGDEPSYFEYLGPDHDLYVPHHWQPQTHESDPHPEPIVEMIRTTAEASDADFRARISAFLDLPTIVRHAAIENYLAEIDGLLGDFGMNNFYAYRPPNQTRHMFIPWDKSDAMAAGPRFSIVHNIEDVPAGQQNRLWERIWKIEDLKQLYFDTLLACANSTSELQDTEGRTWMEWEIEREYAQIKDHVIADPKTPFTNDDFFSAVSALLRFASERPDVVRSEVRAHRP